MYASTSVRDLPRCVCGGGGGGWCACMYVWARARKPVNMCVFARVQVTL